MDSKSVLLCGVLVLLVMLGLWFWLLRPASNNNKKPSALPVRFGVLSTTGTYGFQWEKPAEGTNEGYVWGFTYELRDPRGQVIATVHDTQETSVALPLPLEGGDYQLSIATFNQFGKGPYTMAIGAVEVPVVKSFKPGFQEPYGQNGRAQYDPLLVLEGGGGVTKVTYSCVLEGGGAYMPTYNGTQNGRVENLSMSNWSSPKTNWGGSFWPLLSPPSEGGVARGTKFQWVIKISGPWGSMDYTMDDSIPGQPPGTTKVVFTAGLPPSPLQQQGMYDPWWGVELN
jgi:hypothetical protein